MLDRRSLGGYKYRRSYKNGVGHEGGDRGLRKVQKIDNTCYSKLGVLVVVTVPQGEDRHCEQGSPTAASKMKQSPKM